MHYLLITYFPRAQNLKPQNCVFKKHVVSWSVIKSYEPNISTQKEKKEKHPRILKEDQIGGWKGCSCATKAERPQKTLGLRQKRTKVAEKKESLVIIKKTPSGFQKKPLFVVVGKNVSKKAVERNTTKRRIRAIIRSIAAKNTADITIIAKKEAARRSFDDLKKAIEKNL